MTTTIGDRPEQRWRLLVPETAVVVHLARPVQAKALIAAVPPGTSVAVVGGRGSRRFARRNGIDAERIYLALPSLDEPVVVAELTRSSLAWFTGNVLTVPSGRYRFHGLLWAAVRIVRRWPRLLVRAPVGDRIVIGARR